MLNDDLTELEQNLRAETYLPPPDLRNRVLTDVQTELTRPAKTDFWHFAAAVAAAVLLGLNLAISAANLSAASRAPRIDPARVAELREQLTDLKLGLSEQEIDRQSLLLAAGRTLVPYARPYGSPAGVVSDFLQNQE